VLDKILALVGGVPGMSPWVPWCETMLLSVELRLLWMFTIASRL
jgi:hypothetical protein